MTEKKDFLQLFRELPGGARQWVGKSQLAPERPGEFLITCPGLPVRWGKIAVDGVVPVTKTKRFPDAAEWV